jgi:hypothetical protein
MKARHSSSSMNSCLISRTSLTTIGALAAVCLLLLIGSAGAQGISGTYNVTESWSVTLAYSHFAGSYTGTKYFSGNQTGTLVITEGSYTLINQTGVVVSGLDPSIMSRSIYFSGGGYVINGDYPFVPAYGTQAYGLAFLGCFAVKVSLVDGEVPVFYDYDDYSASGNSLSSLSGGGDMIGESLTATVSSTITLTKVVGPPTIVEQPQARTVYAGQDATFTVTAGGDPPLSYAWRKGTSVLAGKTARTLTLTNVQSADSATYSVIVSNPGGNVTSLGAKLTVNPPPPAWIETWESASLGRYPPATNGDIFIPADEGQWYVGDTAANFPECWPDLNHADIVTDGGRKLLKLVSVPNPGGCAENIWVAIDSRTCQAFPIPLLRSSEISSFEQGSMDNPEWNGLFGCIIRPCGDAVSLQLGDDHGNQVFYIFQRATNYVEHAITNYQGGAYLEVFLDPAGGTYSRNIFGDFARVAGANVGTGLVSVEFSLGAAGWAMLDDLRIGAPPVVDKTPPTLTLTSPVSGQRWSNAVFAVKGTAKDNVRVSGVRCLTNGVWGLPTTTNGWTNWTVEVALLPGTNTVWAYAVDAAGNTSITNSASLDYVVTNQLRVRASGLGTISPNYSNSWLEVGRNYSMTAAAKTGFAFSNWTISTNWIGGGITNNATVRFMMESNLTLQVTFADVTKPKLMISSPANGQKMTNALAHAKGTASDNWKVGAVLCQLNGGAWIPATTTNAWTNWFVTLPLLSGTNTVKAYAVDSGGNTSTTNTVSVISSNTFKLQLSFATTEPMASNGLSFNLDLSARINGTIQVSSNLVNWMVLTNFVGTNETLSFRDSAATNFNRRFYRAVVP